MPSLITGISGQDGSYLAEQLLAAGHQVVGLIPPHEALPPYLKPVSAEANSELFTCDLSDPAAFRQMLRSISPRRVFHLAAISSPVQCAKEPELSQAVNVTSVEVLCEWLRRDSPQARVLTISSAAIFGEPAESPQSEETPPRPLGVYGRQKLAVLELARAARAEGHFVACAIPFNHESSRRTEDFVFAKVCRSAARIARQLQKRLELGDLTPRRDWGYAPEYVTAYSWMLDVERPLDLVLATGEAHSVQELVDAAFARAGLDPAKFVASDPTMHRLHDPPESVGDSRRAWEELGWEAKTRFADLVKLLVDAALADLD